MSTSRTVTVWKDAFYHSNIEDVLTDDDKAIIQDLLEGKAPRNGFKLEKMKNTRSTIMTIRTNIKRRLFFIPRGNSICIIEVMEDHNHDTAHSMRPGVAERIFGESWDTAKFKRLEFEDAQQMPTGFVATPACDHFTVKEAISYNQSFISFDDQQSQVKSLAMPALVVGDPGSGKTAIIFSLLSELVIQAETHENEKLIVYYTASPGLARRMYEKFLLDNPAIAVLPAARRVRFMNEQDLFNAFAPEAIKDFPCVGFAVFKEYMQEQVANYRKTLKKNEVSLFKTKLEPQDFEAMYHEFQIIAEDPSAYLTLGDDAGYFPQGKQREWMLNKFNDYCKNLEKRKKCDNSLVDWALPKETPLYQTLFDEAQVASRLEMKRLKVMTEGRRICYFGDPNQGNYKRRSDIPYLKSLAPNFQTLAGSYRSPAHLIPLLNMLLAMKQHIHNGLNDKSQSPSIHANEADLSRTGNLEWIDQAALLELLSELRSKNTVFAVITPAWLKTEALGIFGGDIPIFSPDEARGLEFETVLSYRITETEPAKSGHQKQKSDEACISALLPEIDQPIEPKLNLPKAGQGNRAYEAYFNQLFICFTRPEHHCFVVEKGGDDAKHVTKLHGHLKKAMRSQHQPVLESTASDWLQLANQSIANGNYEQALAAYKHIGKDKEALDAAVAAYQAEQAARLLRVTPSMQAAIQAENTSLRPKTRSEKEALKKPATLKANPKAVAPSVAPKNGAPKSTPKSTKQETKAIPIAKHAASVSEAKLTVTPYNLFQGDTIRAANQTVSHHSDALIEGIQKSGLGVLEALKTVIFKDGQDSATFLLTITGSGEPFFIELLKHDELIDPLFKLMSNVQYANEFKLVCLNINWLKPMQDSGVTLPRLHWMVESGRRQIILLKVLDLLGEHPLLPSPGDVPMLRPELEIKYKSVLAFKPMPLFVVLALTNLTLLKKLYANDKALGLYVVSALFYSVEANDDTWCRAIYLLLKKINQPTMKTLNEIFSAHNYYAFNFVEQIEDIGLMLCKPFQDALNPYHYQWNALAMLVRTDEGLIWLKMLFEHLPSVIDQLPNYWMDAPLGDDAKGLTKDSLKGCLVTEMDTKPRGREVLAVIEKLRLTHYQAHIAKHRNLEPVLLTPEDQKRWENRDPRIHSNVMTANEVSLCDDMLVNESAEVLHAFLLRKDAGLFFHNDFKSGLSVLSLVLQNAKLRNHLFNILLSEEKLPSKDQLAILLFHECDLYQRVKSLNKASEIPLLFAMLDSDNGGKILLKLLHPKSVALRKQMLMKGISREAFEKSYYSNYYRAPVTLGFMAAKRFSPILKSLAEFLSQSFSVHHFIFGDAPLGAVHPPSVIEALLCRPFVEDEMETIMAHETLISLLQANKNKLLNQLMTWPGLFGSEIGAKQPRARFFLKNHEFADLSYFDAILQDVTLLGLFAPYASVIISNFKIDELFQRIRLKSDRFSRFYYLSSHEPFLAEIKKVILGHSKTNGVDIQAMKLASALIAADRDEDLVFLNSWCALANLSLTRKGVEFICDIFLARPQLSLMIGIHEWKKPGATGIDADSIMLNIKQHADLFDRLCAFNFPGSEFNEYLHNIKNSKDELEPVPLMRSRRRELRVPPAQTPAVNEPESLKRSKPGQ